MNDLTVWLYGAPLAHLDEPRRGRLRLTFTSEAIDTYGPGSAVLSLGLPVQSTPAVDSGTYAPVRAFFQGLLPEGAMLERIALSLRVPTSDTLGLLRAIGMECAGAIQCLPPVGAPGPGTVRRLDGPAVTTLIESLPALIGSPEYPPQASLGGLQDKLLLTRLGDGGWGWPQGGAASTHILKPDPLPGVGIPYLVSAESWALEVARTAGLPAASASLDVIAGRDVLVVERYDRTADGQRSHQEDFCQALGLMPIAKYETPYEHPTRLRRIAALLSEHSPDPVRVRRDLLRQVTYNVAIGNADAHTKNYSALLSRTGVPSVAPLYDCAPLHLMDARFRQIGHIVHHQQFLDQVTATDLVAEGFYWGMDPSDTSATVADVLRRTLAAAQSTPDPPAWPGLAGRVAERIDRLAAHGTSWEPA